MLSDAPGISGVMVLPVVPTQTVLAGRFTMQSCGAEFVASIGETLQRTKQARRMHE